MVVVVEAEVLPEEEAAEVSTTLYLYHLATQSMFINLFLHTIIVSNTQVDEEEAEVLAVEEEDLEGEVLAVEDEVLEVGAGEDFKEHIRIENMTLFSIGISDNARSDTLKLYIIVHPF